MDDSKELRAVALHGALELARGKTQTAEEVVKGAKVMHDFLASEGTKEDDQ